jgi:membrane-bound ClpP family serine protease
VLILGLVLLLIGWLAGIGILTTLGVILLVVGAVFLVLGSVNRPILGRRYWY